ncbi:MAG: DUF1344 domain-containing protein [Pseudomonadota bacterium]
MKKRLAATSAILLTMSAFAHAGEAQGAITEVDAAAMTMTLDNGETYTLPAEFDVSLIGPGMVVALAHEDDAAKTVTDMEQID